ncbi:MAG TPA: NUDIX hydrolase [Geopsychrobacteraceae bacterium]|nr:NUDIX hydrolase [Geopsychrobacteraceae bacterium]
MSDSKMSEETLYKGRILDLARETHQMPDGREARFEIVQHSGGAAALPVLPDGRVILIRQFRPAIKDYILEIPAGRLEAGEDGATCVARELQEEIGYQPGTLETLGDIYSSVGFCNERIYLYVAHDLKPAMQALEPDEFIELKVMTLDEAITLVKNGQILDAKTRVALLHYKLLCEY